jgi:hypothetical protein
LDRLKGKTDKSGSEQKGPVGLGDRAIISKSGMHALVIRGSTYSPVGHSFIVPDKSQEVSGNKKNVAMPAGYRLVSISGP